MWCLYMADSILFICFKYWGGVTCGVATSNITTSNHARIISRETITASVTNIGRVSTKHGWVLLGREIVAILEIMYIQNWPDATLLNCAWSFQTVRIGAAKRPILQIKVIERVERVDDGGGTRRRL